MTDAPWSFSRKHWIRSVIVIDEQMVKNMSLALTGEEGQSYRPDKSVKDGMRCPFPLFVLTLLELLVRSRNVIAKRAAHRPKTDLRQSFRLAG